MSDDKVHYAIVSKNDIVNEAPPNNQLIEAPKGFGARHVQALILFMCVAVGYAIRAQLSVSMVAMTNHDFDDHGKSNTSQYCITTNITCLNILSINRSNTDGNLSNWNVYRKYDWDEPTQEMILFSFFVGYTSMMIPMGCAAQKFGGKKPILVELAVNGVLSIVTPWMAIWGGWLAVSICRFLQGATQAALYPSIHTILAKWTPLSERGRLSSYVYTGSSFGIVVIFQLAGVFAGSPSLGWPATFWLCGVLSLLCFALLWWFGAASPFDHQNISVEEMTFILEGNSADVVPKRRCTPWKSILTSSAVWGLVTTHVGSVTGHLVVLTQMPTYMNYILGVDIKQVLTIAAPPRSWCKGWPLPLSVVVLPVSWAPLTARNDTWWNGVYSSLPYMAMYCSSLLFGYLADYATNKKILSIVNIRRTANTIGMVISGACLVGFSYVYSTVPAIILLVLTMATHSAILVGFHINQLDLAPNFAGPIMALGSLMANLTSLLVPVIISNIVQNDVRNQSRWQTVILIFVGLQVVTNLVFVIFAKGTVQPWNFHGDDDESKPDDKRTSVVSEQNKTLRT